MSANQDQPAKTQILTFVVEDYFQVGAFNAVIPRSHWRRFDSRLQQNTQAVLELLDSTDNKATFFACGWVAQNHPQLLRDIVRQGHEVACQSYYPSPIAEFSYGSFKQEVERSRDAVAQATGIEVRGFRVGRGRIGPNQLWALDCLAELGFDYDSSICAIGRQFSTQPEKTLIHQHPSNHGSIWEVPISSYTRAGLSLPIAGGNYVRQTPRRMMHNLFDRWIEEHQQPLVAYFHIWELDKEQPNIDAAHWLQRIRHYRNLDQMRERISYYLNRYRFGSIAGHLGLKPVTATHNHNTADPKLIRTAGEHLHTLVPLTIATPCYNEEATLAYLNKTLTEFEQTFSDQYLLHFLFVDDGSEDNTWLTLNKHFAARENCILVQHSCNRGIAAAILTALENAPTELVAIIDADCTFDPMQLPKLMAMMTADTDLVTASPLHPDGKMANVPPWRLLMSKGAAALYRLVLHHRFASYTSCFRIYRRSKVLHMQLLNHGFSGVTEILARMDLNGAKIAECPAVLEVRLLGQSKINTLRTITDHLRLVAHIAAARIRNKPLPEPAPDYVQPDMPNRNSDSQHWTVLGAGMLGMTLALRLAQAGKRVTLLEAAPELGGLTSAWRLGDVIWDRYYHVTLLSDTTLRDLLSELGLEQEIDWRTTNTNFYAGKDLYPLNNVFDYLKLPGMRLWDKLRMGATIVYASRRSDGVALERYPVEDWLVKLSGRRTFEILWRPLLKAKLGNNYRFASAAFIWSVIRRFYAARRGGMQTEMFGYVPGGYARIINALADKLKQAGVEIRTSAPVSQLTHHNVHQNAHQNAHQNGSHEIIVGNGQADERIHCDRVAVCFAAPLAAKVCAQLQQQEKDRLNDIRYQGVVCASLLLTRPLGGAYLTYITDDSMPFTTVIEMSSLVNRELLGNYHLVYLPRYVPADDPWLEYSDEKVETLFMDGLKKMFPDLKDEQVAAFQLSKTRHVLAVSTLNYSSKRPPIKTSVPGLNLVNSAQIVNASLNVNDTVKLANQSAQYLLQAECEEHGEYEEHEEKQ